MHSSSNLFLLINPCKNVSKHSTASLKNIGLKQVLATPIICKCLQCTFILNSTDKILHLNGVE